jgi:hypothetical protein
MLRENNQARQVACEMEVTLLGLEPRNGAYGARTFAVNVDKMSLKGRENNQTIATLQP